MTERAFAPPSAVAAAPVPVTPVRAGLLQRKCACGGSSSSGGECSDCGAKKQLQRSGASGTGVSSALPVVRRVLRSQGDPLDPDTRSFMESRLGHNFGAVRVHHDSLADQSARAVHAEAFTAGRDVVFTSGRYAPRTAAGRRLLAHELTHVAQQGSADLSTGGRLEVGPAGGRQEAEADAAAHAISSGNPAARAAAGAQASVQRQPAGEDQKKQPEPGPAAPVTAAPAPVEPAAPAPVEPAAPVAAPTPEAAATGGAAAPSATPPAGAASQSAPPASAGGSQSRLQLDPEIEARMRLLTRTMLDPNFVRTSLTQLNFNSILGAPPPPWLTAPQLPSPRQLVPAGPGPGTPQPASMGDLLKGIMKVPAVDSALTSLQTQATDQIRRDWSGLSTGAKVALVTDGAVIGGGALAGILSNPGARQFTLDLLQNRSLPTGVPGLDFRFNLTGPDQRIQFNLNVGRLLPDSLGFH